MRECNYDVAKLCVAEGVYVCHFHVADIWLCHCCSTVAVRACM